VPFTLETLRIIFPYSLTMAAVGLLESMMTAQIVDDLTDTPSNKRREMKGQGIANFLTGFLGGMGGCAMIGRSVINVKSGGSTRLSTFVSGAFLLFLIVVLGPLVARIPMPALVAVVIMVSIGTFSWGSIRNLKSHPWQSSVVMLVTVLVVVSTHDLAQSVVAGVILSGLFFASKVKRLFDVASELSADGRTRTYRVSGQVFFASSERFADAFDFKEVLDNVVIDLTAAHFWDISAVGASTRRSSSSAAKAPMSRSSASIRRARRWSIASPSMTSPAPKQRSAPTERGLMNRILACIDASTYATSVVDLAAWAATRLGADVELHVVQRKDAVASRNDHSGAIGLGVKSELLEELTRIEEAAGRLAIEEGRILLDAGGTRLKEQGITVASMHLHGGIVETIVEREADAALVIIGKRGASGEFATDHIASKVERVVRASDKPVLIASREAKAPDAVVIAFDNSPAACRAVRHVATSLLFGGLPRTPCLAGPDDGKHRDQLGAAAATLPACSGNRPA
jgi:MFS superfamily sulfate permease-like transporter